MNKKLELKQETVPTDFRVSPITRRLYCKYGHSKKWSETSKRMVCNECARIRFERAKGKVKTNHKPIFPYIREEFVIMLTNPGIGWNKKSILSALDMAYSNAIARYARDSKIDLR